MAIASFQLDPNAVSYTDDQIVGKINSATADITRADSVAAAARPIGALEITNSHIATDAAIPASKLASTAAKDNLDALADTARGYIKTDPTTGEFTVVSIQRDSTGKLDVDYDDVAV
uniref:Uncharacterized protein n=1 Tax=viral metagenome TaxID=1070528 RepID=A0A6M3M4G6_9ZZZZ